jgi:MOSC domain-containing protein YiiM
LEGTVEGIRVFPAKGKTGIEQNEGRFIENLGLEGDYHASGGERQISLSFFKRDIERMFAENKTPLCFIRFNENITIMGLDVSNIQSGTRLSSGDVVLEITEATKHCHEECELFKAGETCSLAGLNLFARVVKGGTIHVGDRIDL